jgi:hypothetical protein
MVDEVEIKNVGGKYGLASEATMQLILAQLGGSGSAAGSRAQRLAEASQQRSTRANNDAASSSGILTKTFKGAVGAVDGLSSAIFKSGNRISEFSQNILGDGNMLFRGINRLTAYVDDSMDSLRELSSVGASFNNSIFDMKLAASAGEMSFVDFSNMVKENSNTLAMLGGTASRGAEQIALFTRGIRKSDAGRQLMGMGFTIADINEGLVDYLNIQMQSGNRINLRDKRLMAGGEAYLKQLDELAKITGKSREQISKDLIAQQQDAGIRNRINELTGEQQTNFTGALEYINTTLPGLAPGLKDLMDGYAQTDLGRILSTQVEGLGPLMEKVYSGQISAVDFNEQLKLLGPEIERFQSQYSKEMLDSMRAGGGIGAAYAEAADAAYQLNTVLNQSAEELQKEYDQRHKLTEMFGNFGQSIETVRSAIYTAFVDSPAFVALSDLGAKLLELVSPTDGSISKVSTAFDNLSEYMLGENGVLTNAINFISDQLSEFATLVEEGGFLNAFQTKLSELANFIKNWFMDTLFGTTKQVSTPSGMQDVGRSGGLFDRMASAFESFWEGPFGQDISDKIVSFFAEVAKKIMDTMSNYLTGGGDQTSEIAAGGGRGTSFGTALKTGEGYGGAVVDAITGFGELDRDRFLSEAGGGIIESLNSGFNNMLGMGTDDWFDQKLEALSVNGVRGNAAKDQVFEGLEQYIRQNYTGEELETMLDYLNGDLKETLYSLQGYKNGTVGFQNFGTVTPANLHGVEAVVPRNTMAGNMLAKTFDDDWNRPKPVSGQGSQENTGKYIMQLNNTMVLVLEELRKSSNLEKRTLNSVKGLSGDLFRGM